MHDRLDSLVLTIIHLLCLVELGHDSILPSRIIIKYLSCYYITINILSIEGWTVVLLNLKPLIVLGPERLQLDMALSGTIIFTL